MCTTNCVITLYTIYMRQVRQAGKQWPFSFDFGIQLGLRQTPKVIVTYPLFCGRRDTITASIPALT